MSNSYYNCLIQIDFDSEYTPIFFDIGCNINKIPSHCGTLDDFTELALGLYPNAKCYGFDPLHWQTYEEKWSEDSRVTVVKKAVSDSNENKTLYIPGANEPIKAHAISSFYNRKDFDGGIDEVDVECITVDTAFSEFDLEVIDYLKIDTEGAELMVLKGAEKCLKNQSINCIQVEYGGTYDDAGITVDDVINYLDQFNYKEFYRTHEELLFAHAEELK